MAHDIQTQEKTGFPEPFEWSLTTVVLSGFNEQDTHALRRVFQEQGLTPSIVSSSDIEQACQDAAGQPPSVIVWQCSPLECSRHTVRHCRLEVPVLLIVPTGQEESALAGLQAGAVDFMIADKENQYLQRLGARLLTTIRFYETERKMRRLSQAVEQSPSSLMITDAKGNIQYVNPRFSELTGYSRQEVEGNNPRMLKSGAQPADYYKEMWQILSQGREWRGEFQNRRKNGEVYWEQATIRPVQEEDGRITHYIKAAEDITDRKHYEERLLASEQQYRHLVSNIPGVVYRCQADARRTLLFVSEGISDLSGYSATDFNRGTLRTLDEITHEEDREMVSALIAQAVENGYPYQLEYRIQDRDGNTHWVSERGRLFQQDGQTLLEGILYDITIRHQISQVAKEQEAKLRAFVNTAADGILSVDDEGIIDLINPAAMRMFGYQGDTLQGKHINTLLPEEVFLREKIPMEGSLQEIEGRRKDGSRFPLEISISRLQLGERDIYTGVFRDITERKKVQHMKNEFISVVSHELRTPLTAIRGSLGLLTGGVAGGLSSDAQEMLHIAQRNSDRLLQLINDILDIEKIESGKRVFKFQPQPLLPLLEQALENNRAFAEQFRIKLNLAHKEEGVQVNVDSDAMMQVFANLLSNAVKFSPEGETVALAFHCVGNRIQISICDRGPGIPEEFKNRIFHKFSQADSSSTRKAGGTGLGLSISKAIVEQHGGSIGFTSREGGGTEFYFTLPVWHGKN